MSGLVLFAVFMSLTVLVPTLIVALLPKEKAHKVATVFTWMMLIVGALILVLIVLGVFRS